METHVIFFNASVRKCYTPARTHGLLAKSSHTGKSKITQDVRDTLNLQWVPMQYDITHKQLYLLCC
jgi:hypothetical protein